MDHFHFPLYYRCASLTPYAAKGSFCFAGSAAESNSAPFAALHLNGVCRWTSQLLLRGSFSKRSTGQTGQRVPFTFTILYMIVDDARLTPPRCKEHTGSTGQQVTFTFHYIINAPASCHTLQKAPVALLALLQSLIRRLLLHCISTAYVGGPRNCY